MINQLLNLKKYLTEIKNDSQEKETKERLEIQIQEIPKIIDFFEEKILKLGGKNEN